METCASSKRSGGYYPAPVRRATCLLITAIAVSASAPALAAAPPRLSHDHSRPSIGSAYGSGSFGRWHPDRFGLPAYRYSVDEDTAERAKQPELNGSTDAWHQLGNDHVVANAYNHGYVQLWSQDRRYQWANLFQGDRNHFAGGFGWPNVGGHVVSTLHSSATVARDFGVGYARRETTAEGVDADETVYAPFGDDPILLHDVTLKNVASTDKQVSWFEYWDVNPVQQGTKAPIATAPAEYDSAARTLSAAQLPTDEDSDQLSIYGAALQGPDGGHASNTLTFFGGGSKDAPAAVSADALQDLPPGASGSTLFAFRAPVKLAPGQSVTLRYAYGAAHAAAIPALVEHYRSASDPLAASERSWARWVPRAS